MPSIRRPLVLLLGAAALVAACASPGGASPSRPTTPEPTGLVTAVPSATATAAPAVEFASALYPYRLTLPGVDVAIRPTAATVAWDGTTRIDSGDSHTDWLGLTGSRTFFVYATKTDMDLATFAAQSQAQVAQWHACPTAPDTAIDVVLGGAPARLHAMVCQGVFVMKLMAVRDGWGLVVNQIGSIPADRDAEAALLIQRLAGFAWAT